MNINQLRYVVEIARTKSFSKAAKSLYISQPALSQYIKKLESDLGVEIFSRNKSSVNLTEAGEVFVKEATEIIKAHSELLYKMQEYSNRMKKSLTLGISQFYGKYFIPQLIPELNKICKETDIKIIEADSKITEQNLLRGDVDIAIIPMPINSNKIKYKVIYLEKFSVAINKKNEKLNELKKMKENMDLSILKDEDFVLLNKGLKLRELAERMCENYGFSPSVILEAENLDTLNSLVHYNIGVSILPSLITKYDNVEYIEYSGKYSERATVIAYVEDKYEEIVNKIPSIKYI